MSELTVREDNVPEQVPVPAEPVNMSALAQWARDADAAFRIAGKLAETSFVPDSIRNQADLTAAILTGQELGLPPMASLRSMDIIYGVPALRAHAMRGLVQSHGHAVQLVESSAAKCVMRGRRKGETEWQTVEWTIERAHKLLGGLKNQWDKQPQTMLIARATGEICRLIAADVLYAAPYVAEELDDQGRPEPSLPVTSAEILDEDGGNEPGPTSLEPPPGRADDTDDPWADSDADAAAELAEETGGWPPVRTPGTGA